MLWSLLQIAREEKKDWKKYFQSLLENLIFISDGFDVINVLQFTFNTRRPLKGRKARNLRSTFSWLKFLVLISFPCFAGLFDHPKLDTKEHDHLKYKTRDKYQSWNEGKIGSTPIQRIKGKIGVWSIRHPPPHPPPLDNFFYSW